MRKVSKRRNCRITIGQLLLAGVFLPGAVYAQGAPAFTNAQAPGQKHVDVIRMRNVRPGIMAYWLDPANNELPREFRPGVLNDSSSKNPPPPIPVQLPANVERIVPVDPQNALLVYSKDGDLKALQDLVTQLDKPLVLYEMQAQIFSVKRSDLPKTFGGTIPEDIHNVTAFTGGLAQFNGDTLKVMDRHVLIIRDIMGLIDFQQAPPVIYSSPDPIAGPKWANAPVNGALELNVSEPGQNSCSVTLGLVHDDSRQQTVADKVQTVTTTTRVTTRFECRNGDTLGFVNVPPAFVELKDKERVAVLAVTVRKIHRYEEDVIPVPD